MLAKQILSDFFNKLPEKIMISGGAMTREVPKWLYCDDCGLELDISENYQLDIDGHKHVTQRVRACRSCKKIDFGDGWVEGVIA